MSPGRPPPPDRFSVAGKVSVVTGGLGQLGRAYAAALHDAGARVVVLDRTAEPQEVRARFGERADDGRLLALACDVTRRGDLQDALAEIAGRWEAPHVLINNAALDTPPGADASENGPFEDYPEPSWDKVMAVNAKGVFLCCQILGGAMAAAGRGSVVNIASIYGVVSPNQSIYEYRRQDGETFYKPAAYGASKAALLNLTQYLATYWAPRGVRVNALTLAGVFNRQDPRFVDAYTAHMPAGRMAEPDDYVGPVLFLASDASRYMTGANLVVDGGWTAW